MDTKTTLDSFPVWFLFFDMATKSINIQNDRYSVVNLPTELLTLCKDKNVLASVAVSMMIKAHNGDSVLRRTSIRYIRETFGVGQARATRIQAMLRTNPMFVYKPYNDTVIARSFRNAYTKVDTDKHGRTIYMMYAVRLTIDKKWTLKQVERYIHDNLYLKAVNATERSDKFQNCRRIANNILSASKDALTLTKMKNIGGVCRSTARRHLYRMEAEGRLTIKRGYMQLALVAVSQDEIESRGMERVRFIHDSRRNFGYIVVPNEYHIADRRITESFRNIIFNHSKRVRKSQSKRASDIFDTPMMAMFN